MTKKRYAFFAAVLISAALVLTACGAQTYTVIYYVGSEAVKTESYTAGAGLSPILGDAREGYEFTGWFYDENTWGQPAKTGDKVEANTDLYARYMTDEEYNEQNGYTVTFVTNGGSEIAAAKYAKIKTMPISKKSGAALVGWHKAADLSDNAVVFPITINEDTKLYADWRSTTESVLYTREGNSFTVTAYNGSESQIVIDRTHTETVNGSTVTGTVTRIAEGAFEGVTALTEVTIPDTVRTIGANAFSGCTNLSKINVSSETETISAVEGQFIISDAVTAIGAGAFAGCEPTSVTLPFTGASRNDNASYSGVFGYVFGYETSADKTPISGKTYQFESGGTYYHYAIPASVKSVKLTGLSALSYRAFYNCGGVESVELNSALTEVRAAAFYDCKALTSVKFASENAPTLATSSFGGTTPQGVSIKVPQAGLEAYLAAWSELADNITAY